MQNILGSRKKERMIRVNGKVENYAVDLSNGLEVSWEELEIPQVSYELSLLTQGKKILFTENKDTLCPFTTINVKREHIPDQRQKVEILLRIKDEYGKKNTKTTVFYTENKQIDQAEWITRKDNPIEKEKEYYKDKPNIILSRSFVYSPRENGDLFLDISGLGYYTVYINRERVNPHYLSTDVTNYDKRIYYDTYKLDRYIWEGENILTVELANGWYNPAPLLLLNKYNLRNQLSIGKPCLLLQLTEVTKEGQRLILESDHTWTSKKGRYLFDNVYIGERVDYRDVQVEEFDRQIELETVSIPGPSGELKPNFIPKIVRNKKCFPKEIKKMNNGYLVIFDQVISGHFCCTITTEAETTIYFKYGELLSADGELNFESSTPGSYGGTRGQDSYPAIQEDQMRVDKGVQSFENQYTYHSFQYVMVETLDTSVFALENVHAYTVHTDMKQSSSFESSNDWFNHLYQVSLDSKLNNIHSYYEDCPRERLGYGGDIVSLIHSQIYSFRSKELLEKVIIDFELEQSTDGGITQTAPYVGIQTHGTSNRAGSLGWQYVVPVILKKLIKHYAEAEKYRDKLHLLQRHTEYLLAFDYAYVKHCCLGDWGSIDTVLVNGKETPPDRLFCSAVFYLLLLKEYKDLFVQLNAELKETEIIRRLKEKIAEIKGLIIEEFYHNDEGYFGEGSQSSYVFALKARLMENERILYEKFVQKLKEDKGILRMGIFGMAWTYECLKREDQQILSNWLERKEFPSFYNMLGSGSNILAEYFTENPEKYHHVSRNHAMFSSYGSWFIDSILGIKVNEQTETSNEIRFAPFFVEGLSYATGHFDTVHGRIYVYWERKNEEVHYYIQYPRSLEAEMDEENVVEKQENTFYKKYTLVYK